MDNNNEKLIDKSYVADSEHIKENSASKSNDEMINKLNQPAVHSPNSNLHKNPLPTTSGLSASNKNNDYDIRNKTNNSSFEANRLAQLNNIANKNGTVDRLNKASLSNAKAQNNTVNSLESAKAKANAPKRKGIFSNILGLLAGDNVAEKAKDKTSTEYGISFKGTAVRAAFVFGLIPIISFSLIIFILIFVIYAKLDHAGIPAGKVLETATEKIEKSLDNSDYDDYEKYGDELLDSDGDDLVFAITSIDSSIYSIKLGKGIILAKSDDIDDDKNSDDEFDIDMFGELYPPSSSFATVDYSSAFFYKLSKLNAYYTDLCGKQVLDIPLLVITLRQESDDMAAVFASNLGYIPKSELNSKRIDETFGKYYDYYYDWSNYEYFRHDSTHDMEILAQHMVNVRAKNNCVYSKDKYYSFLKEFIGKKYYSDITDEGKKNELIQSSIKEIKEYKELYNELEGINNGDDNFTPVSSNSYWWPIGSVETTTGNGKIFAPGDPQTVSTSDGFGCFAWRANKDKGEVCGWHRGVDISGLGLPPGTINVIAVKDGVVIYPTKEYQTQYKDHVGSAYLNNDGGGLGNYVMIEHSDGTVSVYGHMAYNSITVMAGDVVNQGQVIGKVGHTGSSTAAHLHFGIKVGGNYVDPLNYINPDDPRPQGISNFSLNTTTLSKNEFVAKMNNYCEISKYDGFCNILASNAELIYDVSLKNRVNPELVVVKAIAEAGWNLTGSCPITKNYWGIKITNGSSCSSGPTFDNLSEGIEAYAAVISSYSPSGSLANYITSVYNERKAAGCDPAGYGLPGTMEGMQSVYSYLGNYRYSPGDWNIGGCAYYPYFPNKEYQNYCSIKPVCTDYKNCPVESKTTVCEQNEYTAFRLQKQNKIRYDIFGL